MCIFARSKISRDAYSINSKTSNTSLFVLLIGSSEKRTVRNGDYLAAIKNRLYLCGAFETQMQNIEY